VHVFFLYIVISNKYAMNNIENLFSALRIQISDDCKTLLDQLGVYIYDDRGQVEIKVSSTGRLSMK